MPRFNAWRLHSRPGADARCVRSTCWSAWRAATPATSRCATPPSPGAMHACAAAQAHLPRLQGAWLTDEEVEKVMKQYDSDDSGDISFEEFAHLVGAAPRGPPVIDSHVH